MSFEEEIQVIYPASNNVNGEVRIGDREEGNAWEKFTDLEITKLAQAYGLIILNYKINNEIKKSQVWFPLDIKDNKTIQSKRRREAYLPSMATSMARPNRFDIKIVNPNPKPNRYTYYSFSIDDQDKYDAILKTLTELENLYQDAKLKKRYEAHLNKNNKSKDDYTLEDFKKMEQKERAEEHDQAWRKYDALSGGGSMNRSRKRKHKNSRSLKRKSKTSKRKGSKKRQTRKVKKTKRARRKSTKKR